MTPSISTFQTSAADVMASAVKTSLDDVIGTYQGRKITAGGKAPSEAALDLNDPTRFFPESEAPAPLRSQGRQAADAKAQRLRATLARNFPELQNSAALLRFMAVLRRMQREERFDGLEEEMEVLFPDPSVRFAVARSLESDMEGGGGDSSGEALKQALSEYSTKLESTHGPAIHAGFNIADEVNQETSGRPHEAGEVRDFYRQAVFGYRTPADSYQFVTSHLGAYEGAKAGADFETSLRAALDFLTRSLAADLAAARPSNEPSQLREVVDGLQHVRLLGDSHNACRALLQKFHASTRQSVPIDPRRLMDCLLEGAKGERVTESRFATLPAEFQVPPLEPSINFLTQFRDIARDLPPRTFEKPESRDRLLEAMQRGVDILIDQEEEALQ